MEWVETTGRSVEEALDAALDELGVDEDEVEYEILEQPKGGIFGRRQARLRARVRPVSREKPGERQRRNRRAAGSRSRGGSGGGGSQGGGREPKPRDGERQPARRAAAETGVNGSAEAGTAGGASAGTSSRRRRRGGRGRGSSGAERGTSERTTSGSDQPTTKPSTTAGEGVAVETTEPEVSIEEQAQIAETFTRGLVDAFDVGAAVTIVVDDDTILVEIEGASLGLLVGPKGATLSAIEELVRTVVQRQTDGRGARINVDAGGYRAKRREALEAFTRDLAQRVIETGRAQALEPMSPPDRKTVHDAAAEIDGVATESEGEEPRRRVVLRPA